QEAGVSRSLPRITYIIASRNDNFCGDPMDRLRRVLRRVLQSEHDAEVIVADWGSAKPIADVMARRISASRRIRFLHVPPKITRELKTPFSEVHALNLAARNAKGLFIGRLDQDTLIGDRFVSWLNHDLRDEDRRAWFSLRRDLPPGVPWPDPHAPVWQGRSIDWPEFFTGAVG